MLGAGCDTWLQNAAGSACFRSVAMERTSFSLCIYVGVVARCDESGGGTGTGSEGATSGVGAVVGRELQGAGRGGGQGCVRMVDTYRSRSGGGVRADGGK